jgi:excisionase family DNA binding protein
MTYYGGMSSFALQRELLTYAEVAVLLGLKSESSVKRLVRKGKLSTYKIGHRTVRLRRNEVEAYARSKGGIQETLI